MLAQIRGLFVLVQFSVTVAIVIAAMYTFRNHVHKIIKIWMKFQIYLLGIKLEEVGKLDESCDLVLMNHQSILDIIIMEHIHPKHLAWVAKKEITDLPFFGHIIKGPKMISINREDKAGIVYLIKEVKDRLGRGRPIAMFPEGTRSTGKRMFDFKPGAKMIGNKFNLKIQPVIIINTRAILDSKKLTQTPGIVKVIYLEPIQADRKTDWFEQTEKNMKAVFEKEINK